MNAVGIATVLSTAVACTGLVVGVMVVFAKAITGQLAEHSRQLAEHGRQLAEHGRQLADTGRQLAEINRALGRLEGRQAAETSPAQT
ncbi:MAG: hypothetical protein OXI26_13080 [bacterium]|nr:hypothetical protein [bacterium]